MPTPATLNLVIPFDNESGEPRIYWLSEGSAVLLTDDLGALGVPVIRREDRLRAFERLRVPPVATLSHATVIRLGQVVGAAQVVIGSFELDGQTLTVRARTIRLDTGRMSAELIERGPLNDLLGIYERLARRIGPANVSGDGADADLSHRCRRSSSTSRDCSPKRPPRKSRFSPRRSSCIPASSGRAWRCGTSIRRLASTRKRWRSPRRCRPAVRYRGRRGFLPACR